MSKLTLQPPLTGDGGQLSDELQDELLCSEEPLSFSHTKRDRDGDQILDADGEPIVLARHNMILDTSRASSLDLIAFQKLNAQVYADAQERRAEIEAKMLAAATRAKRAKRSKQSDEDQASQIQAEIYVETSNTMDLVLQQRTAKAGFLYKLVSQWTLRSNGAMIEPSAEFLLMRSGPGVDAFEALDEWYFPTSNGAEEETGMTENPSTPAP